MNPSSPINLRDKLDLINEQWTPKVIAELNDSIQFKLAKIHGDFVWHVHDDTDEAFYVLHGQLIIELRNSPNAQPSTVTLNEGDFFVVHKGIEHITRAPSECHILIIEPRGVVNTGLVGGDLTAPTDVWL